MYMVEVWKIGIGKRCLMVLDLHKRKDKEEVASDMNTKVGERKEKKCRKRI